MQPASAKTNSALTLFLPLDAIPLPAVARPQADPDPANQPAAPGALSNACCARAPSGGRVRLPPAPRRRQATRPGPTAPHARPQRLASRSTSRPSCGRRRSGWAGLVLVRARRRAGCRSTGSANARANQGQSTGGGLRAPDRVSLRDSWPARLFQTTGQTANCALVVICIHMACCTCATRLRVAVVTGAARPLLGRFGLWRPRSASIPMALCYVAVVMSQLPLGL